MEKDFAIGSEGSLVLKEEGGKLIIQAVHNHVSGSASFILEEDMKYFLEKLRPLLPSWASMVIDLAEASLP